MTKQLHRTSIIQRALTGLALAGAALAALAVPASAAPAKTVAGLSIQVTYFAPAGRYVVVDFEAVNNTTRAQRFWWPRFVLQAPNGTRRTAYRDPATAPYQLLGPNGNIFAAGGYFLFHRYQPGRYVIRYAGKVLERTTL
jgi:hypothetical protein